MIKRDRLIDMPLGHQGRAEVEINPRILGPQPIRLAQRYNGCVGLSMEVECGTQVACSVEVTRTKPQRLTELDDRLIQCPRVDERRAHHLVELRAPLCVLKGVCPEMLAAVPDAALRGTKHRQRRDSDCTGSCHEQRRPRPAVLGKLTRPAQPRTTQTIIGA